MKIDFITNLSTPQIELSSFDLNRNFATTQIDYEVSATATINWYISILFKEWGIDTILTEVSKIEILLKLEVETTDLSDNEIDYLVKKGFYLSKNTLLYIIKINTLEDKFIIQIVDVFKQISNLEIDILNKKLILT